MCVGNSIFIFLPIFMWNCRAFSAGKFIVSTIDDYIFQTK